MKLTVMCGDTPYLPQEIIKEILKLLPVKSLIRFHCVSKQWKSLIKSQSFIADHLHHSAQNRPSLLLWDHGKRWTHLQLGRMDCEMQVSEIQMPPLVNPFYTFKMIGSSNGLLCVVIREFELPFCDLPSSILVWNPATGEFREITETRRTSFYPQRDGNGFGFSATLNDFKIVQTYIDNTSQIRVVEVYSLNTGLWKELELGCLKGIIFLPGDCVSTNGFICWVGMEERSYDRVIVSFDIAREVFTLIPLPPISNTTSIELTVYEDKFGIISISKIDNDPNCLYFCIDLWVLEESVGSSMERWSWTKIFSGNRYRLELKLKNPRIIWRNEIVIGTYEKYKEVIKTGGREVEIVEVKFYQYLINIITNEVKMVAIPLSFCYPFNHVESLVPIPSLKNLIL